MFVHRTRALCHPIFANRLRTIRSFICSASKTFHPCATSWYHLLHAIFGATCCWTERFPLTGASAWSGAPGPNSAEHSSEQSVLGLDLFVSVHLCICTRARFCRRTSYQQPETDVGNFSICKGKAPAPLACSITQRNATDLQLRKLIPQRDDGTGTNLGIAIDPSSSCPSF